MQCPQCHQENPPQARFCLACGVRLTLACSACGTALPAGARFCLACGQPVHALDAVQARPTAPVAYTPKHLADKILTSRGALEGERKQVTVLFCDLANSTALAARLGPEAMHTLLNHFFELALAEVHRYEGTINQFLGDGFMALFGAPLAHEDHARRAVLAALGVQQKLRQEGVDAGLLTGGTEHAPPLPLSVRMGLNTGLVVVGSIGAVWDTPDVLEVHLAELKRLEFLYERTEATEPVYVFKHVLTQEVAYDSLLTSRRQALHAAAGRALESLYAERLEEVYDRLAYHYARTAESAKAIEYLTRFAEKAARGYAHVEAVTALQEALVHAGARQAAASTTAVQDRVILALVLRLAHSLYFLGRFQDTLDFLLQQIDKAHDLVLQVLEITRAVKFWYGVGVAQRALGRIAQASGSLVEAEAHMREALQTLVSIQARFEAGRTYLDLAALAPAAGDRAAAIAHFTEAHGLCRALQAPKYVARAEQGAREFGVSLPSAPAS